MIALFGFWLLFGKQNACHFQYCMRGYLYLYFITGYFIIEAKKRLSALI